MGGKGGAGAEEGAREARGAREATGLPARAACTRRGSRRCIVGRARATDKREHSTRRSGAARRLPRGRHLHGAGLPHQPLDVLDGGAGAGHNPLHRRQARIGQLRIRHRAVLTPRHPAATRYEDARRGGELWPRARPPELLQRQGCPQPQHRLQLVSRAWRERRWPRGRAPPLSGSCAARLPRPPRLPASCSLHPRHHQAEVCTRRCARWFSSMCTQRAMHGAREQGGEELRSSDSDTRRCRVWGAGATGGGV